MSVYIITTYPNGGYRYNRKTNYGFCIEGYAEN